MNRNNKTLELFYNKYPKCFVRYHSPSKNDPQPNPFAIDIQHRLARDNPELSMMQIMDALEIYIFTLPYRSAIKAGAIRIDLQGNPTGDKITKADVLIIQKLFGKKTAKIKPTQKNSANAPANKKKREEEEKKKTTPMSRPDSKKQADSLSTSAGNKRTSQERTEVKLGHALKGRATLPLKKKEKTKEKAST